MSISLTTHGMLWPHADIIREQFLSFDVEVQNVTLIEVTAEELGDIEISVTADSLSVEVEVIDSLTGEIATSDVDVDLECT